MTLTSKFNKGICFLLCAIGVFNKNTWVAPLKDNNSITITNAFQKHLDESSCKPNKICVDKPREFCKRSIKSSLQGDDVY